MFKLFEFNKHSRILLSSCALAVMSVAPAMAAKIDGMPSGQGSYKELVTLYDEFLMYKDPAKALRKQSLNDVAGNPTDVFPDYSSKAINEQRRKLTEFQLRMQKMGVVNWEQQHQVDFLAVRSRLDQHEFLLDVSKPWARDPGFYVDQMLHVTFASLPVLGNDLSELRTKLAAIPLLVSQAKLNLTEVAADYADLAIFNLTNADGVGHGYPYRAAPPAGVLGWYNDLLERAKSEQKELVPEVEAARNAVQDYLDWLEQNRGKMTAQAGVGPDRFNWYLKHVELMPYDTEEIVTLGKRELDRLWAMYALEQHRNRDLPELELSSSAEEYQKRIDDTDALVRKFLVDEEVITIPDYIQELNTNVPWIVRPSGPNFWEQIQYRDPMPDHLHAVIPGHSFDGVVERHNENPIRGRLTSGSRAEGWGVYLEEGMMQLGILEERPRTRELIYLFGIFRAARVPADVWLQLNEMTVNEVVDYWMEHTPYLDKDVARVDAEIYLRRPPGYGLGYMIGMIQMQQLLADRKMQLRDDFVLKKFHDHFMEIGRLPISLIRWEMTGLDDEIRPLWTREPLPK